MDDDIFINAVAFCYPEQKLNCLELAKKESQPVKNDSLYRDRTVVGYGNQDGFFHGKVELLTSVVQRICSESHIKPRDIEFIYFFCTLPMTYFPLGNSLIGDLKNRLKIKAPHIHLGGHQCAGLTRSFLHAHSRLIGESALNNILLLTVDCVDFSSKRFLGENVVQGDAASAVFLSRCPGDLKLKRAFIKTNPKMHDMSYLHHEFQWQYFFTMRNLVVELLKDQNLTISDIDVILPHYSSMDSWQHLLKILAFEGKFLVDQEMTVLGHLFGTDLVIGLQKAMKLKQKIKNVLALSYGVGSSWGALLLEKNHADQS